MIAMFSMEKNVPQAERRTGELAVIEIEFVGKGLEPGNDKIRQAKYF